MSPLAFSARQVCSLLQRLLLTTVLFSAQSEIGKGDLDVKLVFMNDYAFAVDVCGTFQTCKDNQLSAQVLSPATHILPVPHRCSPATHILPVPVFARAHPCWI